MVKQKALLLLEKQGSFDVRELDIPKPAPGELLVQVVSTGLNPVDWKIAKYGFAVTQYPAVLGSDSAGVVAEVGEGVTEFKVGDKVVHQGYFKNEVATFQQYTIVPAEIAAKIPSNLTDDEAATLPLAVATAVYGFYSRFVEPPERGGAGLVPFWAEDGRGKYAGKPILIIGGSSAVGQQAIQVARLSGFSPIITTASLHNADYVKSLGATHVIDRSVPLVDAVKAITSEQISIVYDSISEADTQNPAWEILAPSGTLILVLNIAIDEKKLEEGKQQNKKTVQVFGTVWDKSQGDLGVQLYKHLTAALESGEIKPNRVEVLPNGLAGIPEGLEKLRLNKVSGTKLIAHPQETV